MNKAYRVVFNKATGVWMAVSEIARGRGKGRSVVRPVGAALIASAALFSAPGAMAQVLIEQPDDGGPINIGSSVTGGSVSFSNVAGQNRRLTGIENGVGTTDAVTVNQLNGALTALGGRINSVTGAIVAPTYTLGADSKGGTTYSTVPGALGNLDDRIKGNTASIVNNTTNIANLTNGTAGMVQQATAGAEITVAKDTDGDAVNFGGKGADGSPITRKLTNVTAGTNATDAVNFSQLSDVKNTAELAATKANNSVQYDAAGNTITLTNPATGTGPVQIKNVAAGTADTDAVNKSQLDSVKAVADNAVQYDSAAKNSVTLGNVGTPVKLSNVADGAVAADSKDAVNGGQLFDVKAAAEKAVEATKYVSYNADAQKDPASATGADALAVGGASVASGNASTALGAGAGAVGNGSVAVGNNAGAGDTGAIAIGQFASTNFASTVAIGTGAEIGAKDAVAIGANSFVTDKGENSIALGTGSIADRASTVSVGSVGNERQITNVAAGTDDTDAVNVKQLKAAGVVGDDGKIANVVTYSDATKSAVQLGNAGTPVKLSNVADGESKNDAVNFGQLSAANALNGANAKAVSDALGGNSTINADGKMTSPTYVLSPDPISGKDTFNNVGDALASLNNNIVSNAETIGKLDELAVKYDTDATGTKLNSVTLDSGSSTDGVAIHNVAKGDVAKDSKDAVNGGQLFDVKSTAEQAAKAAANSVQYDAAGNTITLTNPVTGTGPVQIKNVAAGTDDTDAVNVKQLKDAGLVGSDGKLANVVTYDSDKKDSVTLGGLKDDGTGAMVPATAPVKLSNIANGVNANDAVNFSQLNGVGSALGGGAGFNNGVWTGPTYTFRNGDQSTTVGDALSKLDNRVFTLEGSSVGGGSAANDKFSGSGANNGNPGQKEEAVASGAYATASGANAVAKGQNSTATGANARATADNSVALGAGSIADTANTVSVGSVGNERAITNVAEGTNPTDAVNKAQMDRQIAGVQNSVGNLQNQVSQIDSKVNRVGAMNAAMSTMMASAAGLQTDNRMAIGTGLYRGETALAIGYQRKVGSRATVTIGGSTAGGKEYNVGVGAGFGW